VDITRTYPEQSVVVEAGEWLAAFCPVAGPYIRGACDRDGVVHGAESRLLEGSILRGSGSSKCGRGVDAGPSCNFVGHHVAVERQQFRVEEYKSRDPRHETVAVYKDMLKDARAIYSRSLPDISKR
jgi:hypothetical protein